MKNQRLKQIAFSLGIVLSLFASSISACVCLHHYEEVSAVKVSCHEHSTMPMMENRDADSAEKFQNVISENECCRCVQFAPKVFSKSDILKVEKQTAKIFSLAPVEIGLVAQPFAANPPDYVKPFYLSDSVYNIKSPRAPPRL